MSTRETSKKTLTHWKCRIQNVAVHNADKLVLVNVFAHLTAKTSKCRVAKRRQNSKNFWELFSSRNHI